MNSKSKILRGTVVNGTAAYAAGDQIGAVVSYSDWTWGNNTANIMNIDVTLLSGYAAPLDLYFFDISPTVVADNAAGSFTVANQSANRLGLVQIAAADYVTIGSHYTQTKRSVGLTVQSDTGVFYMAVISATGGTPTFSAASHIIVNIGLLQDG